MAKAIQSVKDSGLYDPHIDIDPSDSLFRLIVRVGFSLPWDITVVGRLSGLVWLELFRCCMSFTLSADQANEYPGISISF